MVRRGLITWGRAEEAGTWADGPANRSAAWLFSLCSKRGCLTLALAFAAKIAGGYWLLFATVISRSAGVVCSRLHLVRGLEYDTRFPWRGGSRC